MAANRYDRTESVLQSLESELSRRLRIELAKVINGKNSLFFFNEEYNPHEFPARFFVESSIELVSLSKETVHLRQTMMLPTEQCIGSHFLAACRESADLANKHRLGPKRLAERLLSKINEQSTPTVD